MEILTLQKQELVQRLKKVATDENTTPEALLDAAVGEFLDKWVNQKIQAEISAFAELHQQLVVLIYPILAIRYPQDLLKVKFYYIYMTRHKE